MPISLTSSAVIVALKQFQQRLLLLFCSLLNMAATMHGRFTCHIHAPYPNNCNFTAEVMSKMLL